jgi:hypothetical protein
MLQNMTESPHCTIAHHGLSNDGNRMMHQTSTTVGQFFTVSKNKLE